jgi:cyclic pyranopterin phosphate synthase
MPADGVALTPRPHLLTTPELTRLAALFAGAGVTKVRLTGGEPTLRPDVASIAASLAATPGITSVALTTNGVGLAGPRLAALAEAGVTAWNVSLDTLLPARFASLTRRAAGLHASVLDTIHQAAALPNLTAPVKVNVVLMRGVNDDEVPGWVAFAAATRVNVRFIEFMPFTRNAWEAGGVVPWMEVRDAAVAAAAAAAGGGGGLVRVADPAVEVAKNFVLAPTTTAAAAAAAPAPTSLPLRSGSISFVTSMTDSFCGGCNRVRLMADGALKVCLFGAGEVSLRDAVREGATDAELRLVVAAALSRKKAAHAGLGSLASLPNREMVRIGG